MKLTVQVRWAVDEKGREFLSARVVSTVINCFGRECQRFGDDLLKGRRFTVLDNAISAADAAVMKLFKLVDPPEIEWLIEDYKQAAAKQ